VLQAIHSWLSDYHDNVKCSPGDDASKCAICLSMDEALAALEESK